MKTLLVKLLTVISPLVALNSFCAPVKADMGAIYAQNAINMMTVTTNNSINENLTRRSVEMNRDSSRASSSQGRSERSEPSRNSAKVAAVTIFAPDPAITTEILNDFANSVDDPIAKKFITRFLTPRSAKKL